MLGSRLARRIVVPLLFLLAALFGLLAWAAVAIAEARVDEELEAAADRVADALKSLSVPAEHRAEVLPSLARLTGSQLIVVGPPGGAYATVEGGGALPEAELRRGRVELGGIPYRVLARRSQRRPERTYVLTDEEGIAQRRRDVLVPILVAGAGGLLAAFGFGLLVTRSVVRPVRALAETARRVASGEFAGTLGRRGPGEIGDLEEAFGRMLEAIRRGEARLRETERFAALGRLAGGIAHELRNPLTAIRLAVESAAAEDDPRLGEEARRVALAEIERLERTLSELLHYVRPRPLRLEELSVARLLAECAGLLRPQLEHLSVALAVEAAENLTLRGDADRLRQAILNLVLNAAQAQPEGGRIELNARPGEIAVADHGPGIPEPVRADLYEPFVTTRAAGIGLGLAVVKQVADEHGFGLRYETGPEGTTFFIEWDR